MERKAKARQGASDTTAVSRKGRRVDDKRTCKDVLSAWFCRMFETDNTEDRNSGEVPMDCAWLRPVKNDYTSPVLSDRAANIQRILDMTAKALAELGPPTTEDWGHEIDLGHISGVSRTVKARHL